MRFIRPADAAKLFLQPRRKAGTSDAPPFPQAERIDLEFLDKKLVLWRAGAGPVVLMVHGWQGTAADMQPFVAPLLDAGLSVAAIDLPAHGASEGTTVSLNECVHAVRHVLEHVGAIHAVIAHSAGCPVIVEVLKTGCSAKAAVLISPLARYLDIALQFGMVAGLGRHGAMQMIGELRALGADVGALNAPEAAKSLDVPALIIHSDDDRTLSPTYGKEIADAWPDARFMQVHGLGHQKILEATHVVDAVTSFIVAPALGFPEHPKLDSHSGMTDRASQQVWGERAGGQ
ncbi:alpha/beta hydrolase [Paraburkholderia dinghuensis]|uniref:Alpha/beta hydrolase n=1 Tax=Paraburkholderia dinghuensis TaxID=2305225 RepID=A0A3N6NII2_9BURK|nr:alpha/beta hydrolase [Paraburkholderia dinghuensis]RQH08902.1 alpha/beta hydrolase [Paraburkholderia dinghuensis]